MATNIGIFTKARRHGVAHLRIEDESGVRRVEELRISFLKPTESLWREFKAIEEKSKDQEDDQATFVEFLLKVDIQSPDITNDDDTIHHITKEDLLAMSVEQLIDLKEGVAAHFFLKTPVSTPETTMNSTSAQEAVA
jgi:hypothetical protein